MKIQKKYKTTATHIFKLKKILKIQQYQQLSKMKQTGKV